MEVALAFDGRVTGSTRGWFAATDSIRLSLPRRATADGADCRNLGRPRWDRVQVGPGSVPVHVLVACAAAAERKVVECAAR
jgi:hypothetical protein